MKPTFFSITIAIIVIAILSMFATNEQYDGEHSFKAPSVSTLNTEESSQNILQNSEKDILFIENLGQIMDTEGEERPDILFFTRSGGVDMYMTSSGISYVFRDPRSGYSRLDMEFVGINKNINIKKELAVEQQFRYYTEEYPDGLSPKAYKKLTMKNIYEGIDLVYYEKEGSMKYDFILKAGADAGKIKMKYEGAKSIHIDVYGNVIITTPMGEIMEGKPYTYSRTTGSEVESKYRVKNNTVLFDIAKYDVSEDIIIDPLRIWATYYGGSNNDAGNSVITDNSGNLYVAGVSASTDFPVLALAGAYNQDTLAGDTTYSPADAFILKFNSSGERIWATYYGGAGIMPTDDGRNMCIDGSGNLYVTGQTQTSGFPTQILPGAYNDTTHGWPSDVFILKFNSSGERLWATFYGESGYNTFERGESICMDNSGNLYVAGWTNSPDFPTQELAGAYNQSTYGENYDAFILKFNSSGARVWATYYGGNRIDEGHSICTDNSDNLYVTGRTRSIDFPIQALAGAYNDTTYGNQYTAYDAFILKFNSSGERIWATYYGGNGSESEGYICTDDLDNLYVTGGTGSSDFPVQTLTGAYNQTTYGGGGDVFILKFNSSGARQWATYYGGSGGEQGKYICTDNSGKLFITGSTNGADFPTQILTGSYNQNTLAGGNDAFILEFNSSGARQWATYYGGSGVDEGSAICIDASDYLYVTGRTESSDFPLQTLPGAYNQTTLDSNAHAFILKFDNIIPPYCTSFGNSTAGEWIQTITFGTYTNNSGNNNGYLDDTGNPVSVESGQSYSFTGTPGFSARSRREYWRVWIDFNNDGDFEDEGEEVFAANNKRGTVSGSISIPGGLIGDTWMRVSMKYASAPGQCEQFAYGEVEEYKLTFTTPVPQAPVADFEGTPTTVTEGESVDFTDLSLNDPISWAWTFTGGMPASSTEQNPTVTYDTEGTYAVSLTVTNDEGSDTKTVADYITVNPAGSTTYCGSSSQSNDREWIAQHRLTLTRSQILPVQTYILILPA
jgi:hypothetical protein